MSYLARPSNTPGPGQYQRTLYIARHQVHKRTGRVSFRGAESLARIFVPLLVRKSSGVARMLPNFPPPRKWLFVKF